MRSVHSSDLRHLAFADGFGLTRISLPGKAKTERKVCAGLDAAISVNAARTEVLAWRESWDAMHHFAFPSLKPLTKLERFQLSRAVLAPDGGFADVIALDGDEPVTTLRRWGDPSAPPAELVLRREDAPARPGVALDGAEPAWRASSAVTSPAGVWASLVGRASRLLVGDLSVAPGRLRWSAPVGVPREALVTLHPFDDGQVVVCAFSPSRRESTLVRFDATGNVVGVHTLASLGPAVPVRPDVALHQIREETVGCTPLDGGVCRATGVAAADHGVGRVFGDGPATYFLPWHAETVLDLRTADAQARKLAPEDAALRRFFRERIAWANALGMPGGVVFELRNLDVTPARREYGVVWECTGGAGSLRGVLAAGALAAVTEDDTTQEDHGWRRVLSGGVTLEYPDGRWDDDEVDAAFGALESAGVPLLESLQRMIDGYDFLDGRAAPRRAPFTREGARRFLAGMAWSFMHKGAAGLRAGSRGLAEALDAPRVLDALKELPVKRGPRVDPRAMDLLCCLAAHALRHDAARVIAAMCRVPEAWRFGLGRLLEGSVRWLKSEAPEPDVFATMLALETGGRGEVDHHVRRGLG